MTTEQPHATTGPGRLGFARAPDVDLFVERLEAFERGELSADDWRGFLTIPRTRSAARGEEHTGPRHRVAPGKSPNSRKVAAMACQQHSISARSCGVHAGASRNCMRQDGLADRAVQRSSTMRANAPR